MTGTVQAINYLTIFRKSNSVTTNAYSADAELDRKNLINKYVLKLLEAH